MVRRLSKGKDNASIPDSPTEARVLQVWYTLFDDSPETSEVGLECVQELEGESENNIDRFKDPRSERPMIR
jgi:hypothetical protein